jgi:hypothetical protein
MLSTLAVALAVGFAAADAGHAAPIGCRLEGSPRYRRGGPVTVKLVVRNDSNHPLSFLDWQTPFEGLLGDIFRIEPEAGGTPLAYHGPTVKRGDPEADEYVVLAAHEETSAEVDLTLAYPDLQRPGRHRVVWRGRLFDVTIPTDTPRSRSRHEPLDLDCGHLTFSVD